MQRKLTKQFLSLLLVFVMILQSTLGVFAKSVTLDRSTAMSSYLTVKEHTDNLGAHHDEQGKRVFKIDGQYAYCIESDVGLSQDKIYQDGHSPQDILEKGKQNILTDWKEKYQMISALLTLVPSTISTNSKTEHIHWLVGQTMIWEITGEERDWDFTYKGPTRAGAMAYRDPFKWVYATDKAEFDRFYKEIEQKMLTYWKLPSFTSPLRDQTSTFDLNQFDGTYYYTTLTDTNNVLSNFDFNADGFEFFIKDNVLKVMTKNPTTTSVTINTLPSRELKMRSPLFWADGAFQKTVTAGEVEDASPFAYFKVKVAVGNLKIVKKDNKGNYVPHTSFTISYHADMTQPIGTYTTDEDGTVTINGLTAQNVYIQETKVPDHLVLDSTIQSILVEPSKTVIFTKTNLQKGHLTIAKQDNKGNYISDVEFKVSYNADMTNAIGKFKTDNQGKIYLTNLHLGTIYVQELSVPSHLMLDNTVHELEIKTGETTSYTQVNNWKQGYIQVAKKDADTNKIVKIAGTKFDILDHLDKVIATIMTDETGIAKSELLDYGTYYVRETLAPNGYTIQIAFLMISKLLKTTKLMVSLFLINV